MRATAELKAKVSSASVTAAMQRCVACRNRRAAPSAASVALVPGGGRLGAAPATSRYRRWVKRCAPATPASVHSMSRSGGLSERMNQRAVSAP
jgi:hypothetical protein